MQTQINKWTLKIGYNTNTDDQFNNFLWNENNHKGTLILVSLFVELINIMIWMTQEGN